MLAALDLAERIGGAPASVRAVEARTLTDGLRADLTAGGLLRPKTTVFGPAFAASLDAWFDALPAAIALQGRWSGRRW